VLDDQGAQGASRSHLATAGRGSDRDRRGGPWPTRPGARRRPPVRERPRARGSREAASGSNRGCPLSWPSAGSSCSAALFLIRNCSARHRPHARTDDERWISHFWRENQAYRGRPTDQGSARAIRRSASSPADGVPPQLQWNWFRPVRARVPKRALASTRRRAATADR
jgi:hypothetical protein